MKNRLLHFQAFSRKIEVFIYPHFLVKIIARKTKLGNHTGIFLLKTNFNKMYFIFPLYSKKINNTSVFY